MIRVARLARDAPGPRHAAASRSIASATGVHTALAQGVARVAACLGGAMAATPGPPSRSPPPSTRTSGSCRTSSCPCWRWSRGDGLRGGDGRRRRPGQDDRSRSRDPRARRARSGGSRARPHATRRPRSVAQSTAARDAASMRPSSTAAVSAHAIAACRLASGRSRRRAFMSSRRIWPSRPTCLRDWPTSAGTS